MYKLLFVVQDLIFFQNILLDRYIVCIYVVFISILD